MAYEKGITGFSNEEVRRRTQKKKKFVYSAGQENNEISYKDANKLKRYVSNRGKILPRRSQETVQNIRELLQLKSREQDIWQLCHTFRTNCRVTFAAG